MIRIRLLLLALAAGQALACDASRPEPTSVASPPASSAHLTLAGKRLDVTLTVTEKERRHAVPRLSPATESLGHLLAWPRERYLKIESEGSRVPFDVLFLDKSGAIVDLGTLKANDEEGLLPRVPASMAVLVAPGLPQKLGLKVGDRAELSPEIVALKPEDLPRLRINGVEARVELALTEAERQHGLMFRPRMSPDDGMLFAYGEEGNRSFWMANTMIPLDIAFFASDGTLLNVNETPMYPDPRHPGSEYATSNSRGAARYVLEMNLGWFKKKGLVDGSGQLIPGSKAELPPQAARGAFD